MQALAKLALAVSLDYGYLEEKDINMEQLKFYGLDIKKDKVALENVREDSSVSKDFEI